MNKSNRLPILQDEIRAEHRGAIAAARTAIDCARAAGMRLIEAKGLISHGQWLPWLAEIGIEPRTAQRYMQLAQLPDDKYDTVSHLGIKAALDAIGRLDPVAEIRASVALPALDQVFWGSAGPDEGLAHPWHEFEGFVWQSTRWPGSYYVICYIGSEVCTIKKPARQPYGFLKHLAFPIDTADWQICGPRLRDIVTSDRRDHLSDDRWAWHD